MSFRTLLLTITAAVALCVPAVADAAPTTEQRAQLLGDYLAGSYARYLNDPRAQSRYFQDAYAIAPDDVRLGRLALYSALFSGDQALARKTAQKVLKQNSTESFARAVMTADAMSRGRSARVKKYAAAPTSDVTMGIAMTIMAGWNDVDEGRLDSARKRFSTLGGGEYFRRHGQLQIAKLEARAGNDDAAEAAFNAVDAVQFAPLEYTLSRARFEAGRGDTARARELLEAQIESNPAAIVGPAGAYLERLDAGKPLPKVSIRAETASALTEPAFAFFMQADSEDGAETYLRLARWIDPDLDRTRIWLGGLLDQIRPETDEDARSEMLALYSGIEPSSPYFVSAELASTNILFQREQTEEAMARLERLAETHPSYYTREALGRTRFFEEDWEGALPFYTDLVETLGEDALRANPEPLRLRGIIYERLDRWAEAEADMKRVLEYTPDDSDTLNYLGYTWVDRGENLEEAFEMIERALELEPQSGAITDSLGWAHYKLGRYTQATRYLEDAVVLTPYSATIIDHLGDAYWRIGKRREATYQWKRALEYDPTDEERATIESKLAAGRNAVPAQ